MSAIGEKVAVVSLGLSCQTSRQIDAHVPLLRKLTGDETIEKVSLPFDWLISTAHGLTDMIGDRAFFPDSHSELSDDQGRLRHRKYDVFYWHHSRLLSHAGHPDFADAKAKFAHTSGRFEQIARLDRVVGVVSDTQGNLPELEETWKVSLTSMSVGDADAIRGSFAKLLGRDVELLMVSRNPTPAAPLPVDMAYYEMTPEPEGWAGNNRDWAKVFKDYFGNA